MPYPFYALYFLLNRAHAQVFNGSGLEGGVKEAALIDGPVHAPLRLIILAMFYKVLWFLALAGVVMVVAAGVFMILSGGNEGAKDRAKKIILYVVIGLIIVLLARSLVGFFTNGLP